MVKCLLLRNEVVLVSLVEEVYAEIGEPNCKLINPFKLVKNEELNNFNLESWLEFTSQSEIMISSESITTIVDPTQEILNKYLELTA